MSSSAKKQKTVDLPKLPKISDSVEEPIVQTLATVCAKLYDEALNAAWKPTDGSEPDKFLAQPYELSKEGGQYKEGGEYTAAGSKYMYTEGEGALVSGYHVFNKDTTQVVEGKTCGRPSLASYGTVIDGITDFHGVDQAAFPPFAALVVQPKDEMEVRTPTRSPHPVSELCLVLLRECRPSPRLSRFPTVRECFPPPAGPHPHPHLARNCHRVRLGQRCRVLSYSM